jgi:DNA-binding CsgD family transcriptional regulator
MAEGWPDTRLGVASRRSFLESIRHSSYLLRAMAALAARDAERVLRFVAEAQELAGDDPFTPHVLDELGKLVFADWVGYCEQDRVRQRVRHSVGRLGDEWVGEPLVSYWEIAAEHPVCSRHNSGSFRALKLSDFVTLKELRDSRIYAVWFRPCGIEHELNVAIPSPPWHTKTFLFDRRSGRDFTERDRLVLDLLQPHLGRLWRAARTRRRLRAAIEGLDSASEHDTRGVIFPASDGRIEFASPAARRLIRDYFGSRAEAELPTEIVEWLESDSATLVKRQPDRHLRIARSRAALLLEESRDELALTVRERQILAWVARGKTNGEIAEMLWIAPSTVRKHLENVYAKLGVRTRTAAAARLLGNLDDAERDDVNGSSTGV